MDVLNDRKHSEIRLLHCYCIDFKLNWRELEPSKILLCFASFSFCVSGCLCHPHSLSLILYHHSLSLEAIYTLYNNPYKHLFLFMSFSFTVTPMQVSTVRLVPHEAVFSHHYSSMTLILAKCRFRRHTFLHVRKPPTQTLQLCITQFPPTVMKSVI